MKQYGRPPIAWVTGLLCLAALAGCGGDVEGEGSEREQSPQAATGAVWLGKPRPMVGLSQRTLGQGPASTMLLWREDTPPPRKAVVFLHGFLPLRPSAYGGWLRHLAWQDNTIVYPAYQKLRSKPGDYLDNALAGIRAGLEATKADPNSVVAIGHSTGGPLVFDYAAVAAREGLPVPRAVVAVYPGRNPPNGEIPPADLSQIPSNTWLEAVAGPGDPLPDGDAQAMALLRGAKQVPWARRKLMEVPPPPKLTPPPSVWLEADRLISRARGEKPE